MTNSAFTRPQKIIFTWFLIGAMCIMIQVLIGGITRITESGLSITEWQPISGALPPLNNQEWTVLFEKYQQTDQFIHLKNEIDLNEFKVIFFWEWFHRNWARLIGLIFIIPFLYFLKKRWLSPLQIKQSYILLSLGALQGLMGWLMVRSGLEKGNLFVEHTFLTAHFILALTTLGLCVYFALQIIFPKSKIIVNTKIYKIQWIYFSLLIVQLIYGAFMAGLHAATAAATWPKINNEWIPNTMLSWQPFILNLLYNKITIHFIHRGLAYILLVYSIVWFFKTKNMFSKSLNGIRYSFSFLFIFQILLGIFTVIYSPQYKTMRFFAIAHQSIGMFIFCLSIFFLFIVQKEKK